jgi:hypothetical protein
MQVQELDSGESHGIPERTTPLIDPPTQAGGMIWGFDRVMRIVRLVVLNRLWFFPSRRVAEGLSATVVEVLDVDSVRVTCYMPELRWKPGQHV